MAGVPLGPPAPPDRRAAAVDHRRPQVRQRVTQIGEHVPALMHPDEDVLDDVFPGGLVTDDERGQLDQSGTVHPVRLGEARSRRWRWATCRIVRGVPVGPWSHAHYTPRPRDRLPAAAIHDPPVTPSGVAHTSEGGFGMSGGWGDLSRNGR